MKYLILYCLLLLAMVSQAQPSLHTPIGSTRYDYHLNHRKDTIAYDSKGNMLYEIQLSGKNQGVYTDYHPIDQQKKGELSSDQETNKWSVISFRLDKDTFYHQEVEIYHPKGYLSSKIIYNRQATEYRCTYFFENGKPWVEAHQNRQNLSFVGEYLEYYPSGQLKMTGRFKDGFRVGLWEDYHENAQIASIGRYQESYTQVRLSEKAVPEVIVWDSYTDSTSVFETEGNFLRNNRDLVKKLELFRNGSINYPHYYYHRTGKWEYWDENGLLTSVKRWENGDLAEYLYPLSSNED